jgi:4'-phosphopantetheinyl transferase
MSLSNTEAHLWYVVPEKVTDDRLLRHWFEILSEEEKARQQRFVFEKDRHLFLVAHGLLRTCLSKYDDVAPEHWAFSKNKFGKPSIETPEPSRPMRFNLSHTKGMVACLITLDHEVGIDVEATVSERDKLEIAEKYFSKEEVASILSYDTQARTRRFYQFWTLKEAYLKARGVGLSVSLNKMTFRISDEDGIEVSFNHDFDDDPNRWIFKLFELESTHMCAVAMEKSPLKDTSINICPYSVF